MEENLMIVDNVTLEVGKEYFIKYIHCPSIWEKVKITRTTVNGHPWGCGYRHSGVINKGCYLVRELTPETELEQFAREWLKGHANDLIDTPLPILLAKFYNSYHKN